MWWPPHRRGARSCKQVGSAATPIRDDTGVAAGNINISDARAETMELSASAKASLEKKAKLLKLLEAQKRKTKARA